MKGLHTPDTRTAYIENWCWVLNREARTLMNLPASVPFLRALRIWCGVKLSVGWLAVMCFLIAWMLEPLRSFRALIDSNTI